MIRRLLSFASFLLFAVFTSVVAAQCVSLTTLGSASTQNFDTLSNTAGSTTNNLTITGWFMTESGGGARDNEQYGVDTGGSNTGDTYSYGAAGSTDRALGGLRSGTLIPNFGACFTNNTGATVNSLAIAYTGEQWRLGTAARTDQLNFEYSLNATDLVTGAWTGVSALNFVTPDTATTGAKNGNASTSRTALSSTVSSLSIANGATFWIRWVDTDASGADDGLAVDDFSLTPIASAAAPTLSVNDVSINEGNAGTTSFTFSVSLSAPAPAGGVTFDIATADGTATTANNDYVASSLTGQTIPAGSSTYAFAVTVNGDTNLETNETFFVNVTNVVGATVADGQGQGTIVNDEFVITRIHDVQGSGAASPLVGSTVSVEGVVVGAFQGAGQLQGFFLQEEDADVDADPNTSEGIFVYCNTCPTAVAPGQRVMATGLVSEFNNMTQITASSVGSVVVTNAGNNLSQVTPATISLPIVGVIDDYYEAREGMLVTYANVLTVSEHFELARYGHIVLHEGGRVFQFTENAPPNAAAYLAHQDAMARRRVILDDDNNAQEAYLTQAAGNQAIYYPRTNGGFSAGTQGADFFRAGDTVTALTGVLHWSFPGFGANTWRIRPSAAHPVSFTPANPRPVSAPAVGGAIKAASVNMLNYFTTIDTTSSTSSGPCGPSGTLDCRGADSVAELIRQRERAAVVLCGLNADVFGLMEMENTTASDTVTDLLLAVNANCGGTKPYVFVNTGGTLGTDAIRVVQIYRSGVLSPVGAPLVDLDAIHNRPPTAQTFDVVDATNPAFGERFTVIANHFKSKGCSGATGADADSGDGQACYSALRTSQSTRLLSWINSTVLPAAGDPDVLLLGDFNSYGKETPVTTITAGGYTDIAAAKLGASAYSYLFSGELGHLDYAFGSASLAPKVVGAGIWHINADEATLFDYSDEIKDTGESTFEEKPDGSALTPPRVLFTPASPFRASDHDPVLVGLFAVSDMSITKTDSPDPVTAGTNLTWTITVVNAGPDVATSAAWSDTLPAGTTFVSLSAVVGWTCTTPSVGAAGTVSCSNASLAVGSAVFSLTAAVSPTLAASTLLSNTATVTAATADPDTGNNSATATTTVSASADLQITKTATPNPVVAGANLTYAIAVNNAGPSNAAAVAMSDTLPVGTTFVSLSAPGGWTCTAPAVGANGTVSCNIASLALGNAPFTLVVKLDLPFASGPVLANTVTATSSTADPTTPVTATATTQVLAPELTVGALVAPNYVAPGQSYTGLIFECRNSGTANATDVMCTPAAGLGTMSAVSCVPGVPVATLAPGETIRCTYDFTADGINGGRDESVEFVSIGGSMSASNFAVLGQLGGLLVISGGRTSMLDAVDDGPTVILNHAAQTVNVLANDSLGTGPGVSPLSVEVTANGSVTCVVGCATTPTPLVISTDGTVSVPALAVPGTYRVPYRVCTLSTREPFAAACDTATATIIVQGADMVSTISCTPTQAAAGTPITCTATCTNNGPATAVNAVCSILNAASLPAGAGAPVCPGSPAATLAAGSSLTCTVGFQMPSAGSVTVAAGGAADNDPVGGNSPSAVGNSVSATLLLLSSVPIPTLGAFALMLLALMLAAFGFAARGRSGRAKLDA